MEQKKSLTELLLGVAQEQEKTGTFKETPTFKILLEEHRFRQDCRKKAFELAMTRHNGDDAYVVNLADMYYKWLTSIPPQ